MRIAPQLVTRRPSLCCPYFRFPSRRYPTCLRPRTTGTLLRRSSIYNPSSSGLYLTLRNSSSLARPVRLCPSLSCVRAVSNNATRMCRFPATNFSKFPVEKLVLFSLDFPCFSHSLLHPYFWFIKPSLLSYFLFPELRLFFKTSYHIFLLAPEPNLNRAIIKI